MQREGGIRKPLVTGELSLCKKVLLAHSHTHKLHIVCGCFHITRAELNSCDRGHVACKPQVFTIWLLKKMPSLHQGVRCGNCSSQIPPFKKIICLCWVFVAACCLSLVASGRDCSLSAVHGLSAAVASVIAEHGLQALGLQQLPHLGSVLAALGP